MEFSKSTLIVMFAVAGFLGILYRDPEIIVGALDAAYEKYTYDPEAEANSPEVTGFAPFADLEYTGTGQLYIPGTNELVQDRGQENLSKPHRPIGYLSEHVSTAVTQMFTLDPLRYESHLKEVSVLMNDNAKEQYHSFMMNSGFLGVLLKEDLRMMATVEGIPLLLKDSVLEGRYRWLFDIPLAITWVPKDKKDYSSRRGEKRIKQPPPVKAIIQIGRIPVDDSNSVLDKDATVIERASLESGVIIEHFEIKSNK
jgi:hypothetical protein